MGVMSARFEEVATNLLKISRISPDEMEAWDHFSSLNSVEGALSPRQKELTAIALSICARCEWCIATHVKMALQLGATNQEIVEAAWMAVLMGGGPSLMFAQRAIQALEEFQDVGDEEQIKRVQAQLAIDSEYKKLYWQLLDYVKYICNEVEKICHESGARVKLAHNIAENDGRVLARLVSKECERRNWI